MDVTPQILHDWMLERKPDDADHDTASCAMCAERASTQEENVSDPIFTQEQHEELLASAVEKATAEATATADADVLRLNEQLEEAQTALSAKDEEIASLKATIEERDEAVRLEALASERVDQVKAIASFSDEQIESRKDSWARKSEEEWETYVEDIKAVAAMKTDEEEPPKSNFDGTRETAGDGSETSALDAFFGSDLESAAQL